MIKGDYKTLKRVLTLTLALAIVAGGYMFEANGAGEQPSKQAPSISEINIYTPKELNARQKDLVEIGRYTASGCSAVGASLPPAAERQTPAADRAFFACVAVVLRGRKNGVESVAE